MSSGTEIIHSALRKIGAHSVISPASPESVDAARDTLNSMIQSWLSKGIDMGCLPLKAPGDELNEPLDAKHDIISNLAVMLAPEFDNGKVVVSATLQRQAVAGLRSIRKLYQTITVPAKKVSSNMTMGAGSTRGYFTDPFVDSDRELED